MDVSTKTLSVFSYNDEELEKISEINFIESENLLNLLNAHKISINQSCGGFGTCTTCRVVILKNNERLHDRNELELERAQERRFKINERLACQIEVDSDLDILIQPATDL